MEMKWQQTEPTDPNDPMSALMADTIEEAYQIYDWLFVFEATMVTHLHADCRYSRCNGIFGTSKKAINK
jgi:hypothetical protein